MSNDLMVQINKEHSSDSLLSQVSKVINYDSVGLENTEILCGLLEKEENRLTNNATALRNIDPQRKKVTEALNSYDSSIYIQKVWQTIGF